MKKEITVKENEYPKYLYHKTEGAMLLKCKEDEDALGKGWVDSPVAFEKEDKKEASKKEEKKEDKKEKKS
jgi:hypothetical protein